MKYTIKFTNPELDQTLAIHLYPFECLLKNKENRIIWHLKSIGFHLSQGDWIRHHKLWLNHCMERYKKQALIYA